MKPWSNYTFVQRGYPPQGIRARYCQIEEFNAFRFGRAQLAIYSFAGLSVSSLWKLEVFNRCHLFVVAKLKRVGNCLIG
jgi:hypothetical protein